MDRIPRGSGSFDNSGNERRDDRPWNAIDAMYMGQRDYRKVGRPASPQEFGNRAVAQAHFRGLSLAEPVNLLYRYYLRGFEGRTDVIAGDE